MLLAIFLCLVKLKKKITIQPSFVPDPKKMCVGCVFMPDYVKWPLSRAQFTATHMQPKTLHRWHIHGAPFAYQNSLNVNREICGRKLRRISIASTQIPVCASCACNHTCTAVLLHVDMKHLQEEDFSWTLI